MGLDAFVYCDCYEQRNLRSDPPTGIEVRVEPTGELGCLTPDERGWSAFLAWKRHKACLHEGMILLRHRLGSTEQVDLLREELSKHPVRLRLLLERVLYSGTHTCDWIPAAKIPELAEEVKQLAPERASPAAADALQLFKIRMAELIIAAQHTGKPICF
jgi:hypothetical protein